MTQVNAATRPLAKKVIAERKPPQRVAAKAAVPSLRVQVSPEERLHMIEQAAYFEAERDDFRSDPRECWLIAEAQIDGGLATSQ